LLAIDLLGSPCPGGDAEGLLATAADSLPGGDAGRAAQGGQGPSAGSGWHAAVHAIVSLAKVAPASARGRLPRFVSSPTWQVRMYAARAADVLRDTATLAVLVDDRNDNVREAALSALSRLNGHASDAVFIAALGCDDYQLVRAAAQALKGAPDRERAVPALLAALARLSAPERQTSRDARMALLDRIEELGAVESGSSLMRYARDIDPLFATRAIEVMRRLAPTPQDLHPERREPARPDFSQLAGADQQTVRVVMRGGRSFSLRLLVADAPLSAIRFLSLVRKGYYDGLTFHRVVPNAIVQGGSPGANEYSGDGPFMRDELGMASNRPGTVGISTRGRDTGDAQIFINLTDNFRYDHDYTVFAEVVDGMDVVDGILEGDTIEKVEIVKS
jgi:cyclophilin family peptidyl-prolyl cis-trans isomerase